MGAHRYIQTCQKPFLLPSFSARHQPCQLASQRNSSRRISAMKYDFKGATLANHSTTRQPAEQLQDRETGGSGGRRGGRGAGQGGGRGGGVYRVLTISGTVSIDHCNVDFWPPMLSVINEPEPRNEHIQFGAGQSSHFWHSALALCPQFLPFSYPHRWLFSDTV